MDKKIATIMVGLFIGWVVDTAAAGVLEAAGVPNHTAKVVGGIVGSMV